MNRRTFPGGVAAQALAQVSREYSFVKVQPGPQSVLDAGAARRLELIQETAG
jgi:hypothetical protein